MLLRKTLWLIVVLVVFRGKVSNVFSVKAFPYEDKHASLYNKKMWFAVDDAWDVSCACKEIAGVTKCVEYGWVTASKPTQINLMESSHTHEAG